MSKPPPNGYGVAQERVTTLESLLSNKKKLKIVIIIIMLIIAENS